MAAVKTERSTAGHKTPPKRPKDWVAPVKVIAFKGTRSLGSVAPGATFTAKPAETDEEKSAVIAYDAAVKRIAKAAPNDKGAEGALTVAYTRLVQLGLRPALRGRYRP